MYTLHMLNIDTKSETEFIYVSAVSTHLALILTEIKGVAHLEFRKTTIESPPHRNRTSIWKIMSAFLMSSVVCRPITNLFAVGVGIPVIRIILPGQSPPITG